MYAHVWDMIVAEMILRNHPWVEQALGRNLTDLELLVYNLSPEEAANIKLRYFEIIGGSRE